MAHEVQRICPQGVMMQQSRTDRHSSRHTGQSTYLAEVEDEEEDCRSLSVQEDGDGAVGTWPRKVVITLPK